MRERHQLESIRAGASTGLSRWLWRFAAVWPWGRTIRNMSGEPYLLRLYLTPRFLPSWLPRAYFHYFFRSDGDRELHNHPWRTSLALILTGGYHEERRTRRNNILRRTVPPWSFNLIRSNDFHRVDLIEIEKGAWTIFCPWNRHQRWGFWDRENSRYIDHADYFVYAARRGQS